MLSGICVVHMYVILPVYVITYIIIYYYELCTGVYMYICACGPYIVVVCPYIYVCLVCI